MDMNNVSLIGRLTRDIEIKYTQTGKTVGNFSIAVNGYKKEDVSFFDCIAWEKTANVIKTYTSKGKRIGLTGILQQQRWDDSDGKPRSKIVIIVREVILLDTFNKESNSKQDEPVNDPFNEAIKTPIQDDSNPFDDTDISF